MAELTDAERGLYLRAGGVASRDDVRWLVQRLNAERAEVERLRTELAAWKPGLRCPHCAERVSYRSEHRQGDRWTCEETDHD